MKGKGSTVKEGIDWRAVQVRLQASERAVTLALTPSSGRIEETLRVRAARLAQMDIKDAPLAPALPVLVFRLAAERYAIEIRHLAEVLRLGYYAPVPCSPAPFLGVIGVRGELRAVVDLQQLVGHSRQPANGAGFVLILRQRTGSQQIGLKVDSIEELREIRPEELTPPATGSFISAMAAGSLPLLNLDAVLASVFSETAHQPGYSQPGHNQEFPLP